MKKIIQAGLFIGLICGSNLSAKFIVNVSNGFITSEALAPKAKIEEKEVAYDTTYSYNVKTLLPYIGMIDYDSSAAKSAKDKSTFGGVYANVGNLNYLLELSYGYINTAYKDSSLSNLQQHDIALMYSRYYESYMLKGGLHHIVTTDTDLNDGDVLALALGGYKFVDYDKYSYGVEGYYSYYKDGHNDSGVSKNISIMQVTPYLGFFKTFDINNKNSIDAKVNYIVANEYSKKNYTSYEISDTYFYKSFFTTLKATFGEMKTGVKDGGMSVINTMDLMKSGYSIKVGYYLDANFIVSASYGLDTYKEYRKSEDGTNSLASASLSYSF